jgi:hypothetical protein
MKISSYLLKPSILRGIPIDPVLDLLNGGLRSDSRLTRWIRTLSRSRFSANKGMKAREQGDLKKTVDLDNTAEIVFVTFTMYTIYWVNGLIKDKMECAEKIRGVLKMLFDGIGEI